MPLRLLMREREECARPPAPALLTGIRQFNAGDYFAAHETLEELWLAEEGPIRSLYQGILQLGVAFLHLQRGNAAGAATLLERGNHLLRPFAPHCRGVDVANLLRGAEEVARTLATLGLERTRSLGPTLFPRIRLVKDC